MKRIAIVLLAAICICGGLAVHGLAMQSEAGPTAVFSVTPNQSTYTQGQAILFNLQLKNTSSTPIIVDAHFALGSSVHPNVTDPQGKAIDWQSAFNTGQSRFQALEPGDSVTSVVCLNCEARDPFAGSFEQTGTYTVRLEYAASSVAAQTNRFPQAVPLTQSVAASPFQFQISQSELVFTAEPMQPTFRVGDPVTFHFQLQNHTKRGVLAAYDLTLGDSVRMRVLDEDGNPVPWTGAPRTSATLLSTVAADNTIDSTYAITPTNLFGTVVEGCEIQKPGTYTAHALYVISQTLAVLQAYVGLTPTLIVPGPIVAPPVKFTVEAAETPTSSGN